MAMNPCRILWLHSISWHLEHVPVFSSQCVWCWHLWQNSESQGFELCREWSSSGFPRGLFDPLTALEHFYFFGNPISRFLPTSLVHGLKRSTALPCGIVPILSIAMRGLRTWSPLKGPTVILNPVLQIVTGPLLMKWTGLWYLVRHQPHVDFHAWHIIPGWISATLVGQVNLLLMRSALISILELVLFRLWFALTLLGHLLASFCFMGYYFNCSGWLFCTSDCFPW